MIVAEKYCQLSLSENLRADGAGYNPSERGDEGSFLYELLRVALAQRAPTTQIDAHKVRQEPQHGEIANRGVRKQIHSSLTVELGT